MESFPDPRYFLDIYGLVAVVRRSFITDNILQPYYARNITLRADLNNGTTLVAKTRFAILRTPIHVNLTSSHPNGNVPFNESMILDAS